MHDKLLRLCELLAELAHIRCIKDPQQFQSLLGGLVHMMQVVLLGKVYLSYLLYSHRPRTSDVVSSTASTARSGPTLPSGGN